MEEYKKRMITEYRELKERTDKLEIMLNRCRMGIVDFAPTCSKWLLKKQLDVMKDYVGILETRAKIEDIDLTDEIIMDKTRRKYDCNHDCEALYEAYQKGREDALRCISAQKIKITGGR